MLIIDLNFVGNALKAERQRLGLSQSELAELTGVSRGTQFAYESGATSPDMKYLSRLVDVGADTLYVTYGMRSDQIGQALFNWGLYHQVGRVVDQWTIDLNIDVPIARRQELTKIIFEECLEKGEFDHHIAKAVLRAA